ncbi:MAG TPA: pitrilysin family protein [Spirochaetota bacterium]|nr:pitrilysin family protein [Spirochaetota bacterium]HPS86964.1 pitrilysin family protein [Spirochaetota bacterium]
MKKFYICFVLIFLMISVNNYSTEVDTTEYFKTKVVEKRLKNGIVLLMMDRGFSPTLAFHISFRVGSVDESYSTSGAAHILEHMLFKGTDKLGTKDYQKEKPILNRIEAVGETIDRLRLENPGSGEIKKLEAELKSLEVRQSELAISSPYDMLYTSNGGVMFNASTSRDMTGYYIQLPSDRIELWAETESARLKNPVFREYYKERDNVFEERLMRYQTSGDGLLQEAFFAAAYSAHPYRHPTIGWESNIKYMSINDIRKFYNTYYIPSRMTITVVGKQNPEETYNTIKKYFEDIKPRPEPGEIKIIEPEQVGEKRISVYFKSRPSIMIGWKKPTAPAKDDYAFDIMQTALGTGKSSRLYKSLVLEKKLASAVYAWNGAPGSRYDNMFIVYAAPVAGVSLETLEKEIYSEMSRFRKEIDSAEIDRVKNLSESSFIFMLDNNDGIAGQLSYYQTVFKDWRYLANYLENLNKVSVEDIYSAFDKYIKDNNRTVAVLLDDRSVK